MRLSKTSHITKLTRRLGWLVFISWFLAACVWRGAETEHYIGPVFFRYTTPVTSKAFVGQVIRFGLWGEAGKSWGLALGVSERVTVDPIVSSVKKKIIITRNRWLMPLAQFEIPASDKWIFSPFYLRVERNPERYFISRSIQGAEIIFGRETNALTVGVAHNTRFSPPADAISRLHYEEARPLESEAAVWLDISEPNDLSENLLMEAMQ